MGIRFCLCSKLTRCALCAAAATVILFEAAAYKAGATPFDMDQPHKGQAINMMAGTSTSSVLNIQASFPDATINVTEGEDFSVMPAHDRHLKPEVAPFHSRPLASHAVRPPAAGVDGE